MKFLTLALVAGLSAAPAFAADGDALVPAAASEALVAGRNADAIRELKIANVEEATDPSRLINLGTAYARMGDYQKAARAYYAAINSDTHYDLQVAGGVTMDSREAARLALANLVGHTDLRMASK